MKHAAQLAIFRPALTAIVASGLLSVTLSAAPPANPTPNPAPVDPATHAAHVAAGGSHPDATPAPAAKDDSALKQQISQLQTKISQLEAALAKTAPSTTSGGAAMPGMSSGTKPTSSATQGGGMNMNGAQMGQTSGGTSMPRMGSGAGGSMNMMGMMEKMMGMMDKMMSMGGGAPASGAQASSGGGMGMGMMDDKMEMGGMGGGGMPSGGAMSTGGGMGMDMDDKMEMAQMMGMGSMGGGAMPQSALPGFPGASHLYHIGATGFFLDHPQHIRLTTEQQAGLNKAKEQALLAKSTADRAVQQAEQELWTLTGADQPDAAKIEEKIREIEKLRGDERLSFIRAVGEASKLLTDEQRKALTGFAPPSPATAPAAPAPAAPMSGGMGHM